MRKKSTGFLVLILSAAILFSSCHRYPRDCSLFADKILATVTNAADSVVFTNQVHPHDPCTEVAPSASVIYTYDPTERVIERKSSQYGPVATLACTNYPAPVGYACFKSISSYTYNTDDNVSNVVHQMEQQHYTITEISYDDKINPLYDSCNKNYYAGFAYYYPVIGTAAPGSDVFYASTLFQFIPLSRHNPTYLKFEGVHEPGYDSHIIEMTLRYGYCNNYPVIVKITEKKTDVDYIAGTPPVVTTDDKGYFFFNYQ